MITDIEEKIRGRVLYNEPMSRHTSFRIGGPADIWIEPVDIEDLKNCIKLSEDQNMPLFVMGNGTNLLIKDEGVRGMVVSMTGRAFKNIHRDGNRVTAGASAVVSEVAGFCAAEGLTGAEFLSGIPGTVGGAAAVNARARDYEVMGKWHSVWNILDEARMMDRTGKIDCLGKRGSAPGGKISGLAGHVILEAVFALAEAPRDIVLDRCRKFLAKKIATQEMGAPSAGCVFKNPSYAGAPAGELIDRCGLKGRRIGGAEVSKKHANFIINSGEARADDVIELVTEIKGKVKDKFGVELVAEIEIVQNR